MTMGIPALKKMYHCKCGEANPTKFYGQKKKICARCHNLYTAKKYQENKQFIIKYLGGKCISCGFLKYNCSLDVHHKNPKEKNINFRHIRGWSKKRIIAEIRRCVLLCRNCHQAYHTGYYIQGVGKQDSAKLGTSR